MPEGGIEELTLGFYYIDAQGSVEEAAVLSRDLVSNSLTVALPHFSFGFFARLGIALVSSGVITQPAVIERINTRIERELASLPDDTAREAFYNDNSELLGPYIEAAANAGASSPLEDYPSVTPLCLSVSDCDDSEPCTVDACSGTLGCDNTLDPVAAGCIDACAIGNGGCDVLTMCSTPAGTITCGNCPGGYTDTNADGTLCTDLDECAGEGGGDNCDSLVSCTNDAGSFSCASCPGGYDDVNANGTSCVDFDECAGQGLGNNCDAAATCMNMGGAFTCTCPLGFADVNGDGTLCTDFSIGGTVTGLTGVGLELQNNGADDLVIAADGSFAFATTVVDSTTYDVTISGQPLGTILFRGDGAGQRDGSRRDRRCDLRWLFRGCGAFKKIYDSTMARCGGRKLRPLLLHERHLRYR